MASLIAFVLLGVVVWVCTKHLSAFMKEASSKEQATKDEASDARAAAMKRHPSARSKLVSDLVGSSALLPNGSTKQLNEDDPAWIEYCRRIEREKG